MKFLKISFYLLQKVIKYYRIKWNSNTDLQFILVFEKSASPLSINQNKMDSNLKYFITLFECFQSGMPIIQKEEEKDNHSILYSP